MVDQIVRIHLQKPNLLVVAVDATEAARNARRIHEFLPSSANFFAKGLAAGFGITALLGGESRINLQITCDGPLGGMFVDCDAQGRGRGYLKNPSVYFVDSLESDSDRSALGSSGALSVIREPTPGKFYRGTVDLEYLDLACDLENYYLHSDQIETAVWLKVNSSEDEDLSQVAAVFVQAMPGASSDAIADARSIMDCEFANSSNRRWALDWVRPLIDASGGEFDMLSQYPIAWECHCSLESVYKVVLSMGREEIQNLLNTRAEATVSCSICRKNYVVSAEQLKQMLQAISFNSEES